MKKDIFPFCFALFLLDCQLDVSAQQRQINGTVVNSDGIGIPSATVIITETKEATSTNA